MPTISNAFVNALLADASYVDDLIPGNTGPNLRGKVSDRMTPALATKTLQNGLAGAQLQQALQERMTPTLATFIAGNFVVTSIPSPLPSRSPSPTLHCDYTSRPSPSVDNNTDDANNSTPRRDPLVIDLNRDGHRLRAAVGMMLFDQSADEIRTGAGRALPDDALLVWDRNGNGDIDYGRALLGADVLKSNGQSAGDYFDALLGLDAKGDALFSSADAHLANLRLWRDLDQGGLADSGLLLPLARVRPENYVVFQVAA